jgi:hypothetical protein
MSLNRTLPELAAVLLASAQALNEALRSRPACVYTTPVDTTVKQSVFCLQSGGTIASTSGDSSG